MLRPPTLSAGGARRARYGVTLLLALGASLLGAAARSETPYSRDLALLRELRMAARWAPLLQQSEDQVDRLAARSEPPPVEGAAAYFGELFALRAIAETELGDPVAAEWSWLSALALDASHARQALAGSRSREYPFAGKEPVSHVGAASPYHRAPLRREEIDFSRILEGSPPHCPRALSRQRAVVVVDSFIGPDGRHREPTLRRVPEEQHPLLAAESLLKIGRLRRSPYREHGVAVAAAATTAIRCPPGG